MPVSVIIKAFIRGKITADDGGKTLFHQNWMTQDLFKHGMTCRWVSLSKLSSGVRSQQMTEGKHYFIKTGWPRIVQARNDMPVSVIIKAFIRGKITADDSSANFQQCLRHQRACALAWQSRHLSTQIQRSQVPLMSLLQRIKWLVVTATPFTWTVKEQYIYIHWCVLMPL